VRAARRRHLEKLYATGKRTPRAVAVDLVRQKREAHSQRADVQRGRYIRGGSTPVNEAGALAILQATLRRLLAVRCDEAGVKIDTVEYKARYVADAAFRERERLRTSGKRWGNRADGRDDGTLGKEVVRRLFARAKKCPYCWQPMKSQDKSLDHMEPLSLGGWHSASNVLVCCRRCNSKKGDTPWAEWLTKIPAACERALLEQAA
jgi:5-methylcytosine-specific restriction endonuclease McrA